MNNYFATIEIRDFDVENFIDDVYNKFCGTPNEESREALRRLFFRVLAMPRGGDASLYPNASGPHPALLEVWLKAGDFWRANGKTKPARLLCDQDGIPIAVEEAQRIAAAKAANDSTTTTATEATETPKDATEDEGGTTAQEGGETPTEATGTPTAATDTPAATAETPSTAAEALTQAPPRRFSASDGSAVAPPSGASEAPSPTPRRRRKRAAASSPSLFDGCEITESTAAPAEPPSPSAFASTLKGIANSGTAREIAKAVGILAAVVAIYECGLIIPFAFLGALAGGLIK